MGSELSCRSSISIMCCRCVGIGSCGERAVLQVEHIYNVLQVCVGAYVGGGGSGVVRSHTYVIVCCVLQVCVCWCVAGCSWMACMAGCCILVFKEESVT